MNRQNQTLFVVLAFFGNSLLKSNLMVLGNHLTDISEDQQESFELGNYMRVCCNTCLYVCYLSVLKKARLILTTRIYAGFVMNALTVKISISVINASLM